MNDLMWMSTGIYHVPNLKKNVSLLGKLDANDCVFYAHGSLLRVKRDSRMMFLEKKISNMYTLLVDIF